MTNSVYDDMTPAEKEVGEYLQKLEIWWQYEQPLYVWDEKGRPRVWTPDFFLPKLGIYIEVCGSKKFNYKYRAKIYEKNSTPIIFLHYYKDEKEWQTFLVERIKSIHAARNSFISKL